MKQYIKWILSVVVVMLILCFVPAISQAQLPPDPGCDPVADPACIPIDGGLSLLIAAGVGYSIKKVRDNRMKQKSTEG